MENNVNNLSGKEWLHNSVNFWIMDSDSIDLLYERTKSFCYKERTSAGYIKNISNDVDLPRTSDFSFSFIKDFDDVNMAIRTILYGRKKSYHAVVFENEFIENRFIFPYFTKNLINYEVEYRGKIIVSNKENDKLYYMLLFLKNTDKVFAFDLPYNIRDIEYNLEKSYIIDTRSKMDKIGLMHPAPFSYIDINDICKKNSISGKCILDPFLGVGSTIIGACEENEIVGIELNSDYVNLTYQRFSALGIKERALKKSTIICGNSLVEVKKINKTIDVVITSPPYFNILKNNTSGVRTDSKQSRQGIVYYSENKEDIGNCDNYTDYLDSIKELFVDIHKIMSLSAEVYIILSDFTISKKETDVHSDYIKVMSEAGYRYCGTSYILQNQKAIYPFGYPYKIVLNHIYQYIIKFRRINNENR